MSREIDIVLDATGSHWVVVEKDTNVLWSREDLRQAGDLGEYAAEDVLRAPPKEASAISGIFPGCLQQSGRLEDYSRYVPVGQTTHFLLFADAAARGEPNTNGAARELSR